MAISELSRVRTELFQLLIIPLLAPHPVQTNRQSSCHRYFGDLSSPPHHQMEILAAPFWDAANRDLGRFHQQKTQYRVSLFRDVAQSSSISTRLLERH